MAFLITERCVKCGACESECPNKAIDELQEMNLKPLIADAMGGFLNIFKINIV